ncbi:MAG: sugar phosphate isomerase/epimerase [Bacteroidales bacterium]|nr:sugar phosphate isomerase/epimerase [Bacteroidales bacterium]
MQRRAFLKTSSLAYLSGFAVPAKFRIKKNNNKIKPVLCLNAYSFNRVLRDGEMSLEELFRFSAETGFAGIDLTAYYIPAYPNVPEDEVLHNIKKMAFRLGLCISGTGVRNNFTLADPEERAKEIELVKNWILAAVKMGAPHVRVFAGKGSPQGHSREEVKSWIIEAFQECADFASAHGVMIAFQNHDDFIVSSGDIIDIMEGVDSEWFGLMLDIGSLPTDDPYAEIEKLIPYAITWQVKENLKTSGASIPTDFEKLMRIVDKSNYQGYFPLETLGEGDPREKVKTLYKLVTDNQE